jgi:DsbC/DsbD-like thiol-disulfide interchange protein
MPMRGPLGAFLVSLVLAACSEPVSPPPPPRKPVIPERLVEVELLAGAGEVAVGRSLRLGVRFRIAPGWHIYWENPGESGLATRVKLHAPAGFEVGPLLYPGPERFESPGELTSYGYEGETVLFSEVTPPSSLEPGVPVRFEAEASWLACQEICLPGRTRLALELPAGAAGGEGSEASGEAFAPHLRRLPRPLAELDGAAVEGGRDGAEWRLVFRVPGASELDFFPAPDPPVDPVLRRAGSEGATRVLWMAFRFLEDGSESRAPAASTAGVLEVQNGRESRYYRVSAADVRPAAM